MLSALRGSKDKKALLSTIGTKPEPDSAGDGTAMWPNRVDSRIVSLLTGGFARLNVEV